MMKKLLSGAVLLSLIGCSEEGVIVNSSVVDQCLRQELFQQCLKALPAGPAQTKYNDWSEVVEQCSGAAYYTAMRNKQYVKPECRA